jgi:hypothetical protein
MSTQPTDDEPLSNEDPHAPHKPPAKHDQPPAGPHADPALQNASKTPGAGTLPDTDDTPNGDVDAPTG